MTSRDWRADRRAVFDRDDHACQHCDAVGDADDPTTLRTYPIGSVPLTGTVHESSLVTVCTKCFSMLQGSQSTVTMAPDELFRLVRATTRIHGGAIADVASFASLATSLPTTLADAAAESTAEAVDGPAGEYRSARRTVRLAIDVVDAHLERLSAVSDADLDDDVRSSLASFSETAEQLQSTLVEVVERGETTAVGLGLCHGCFEPLEDGPCSTCGLEPRETDDWQRDDGELAFDRLFSSINDGLQEASTTTETLTDRTMTLATQLTES